MFWLNRFAVGAVSWTALRQPRQAAGATSLRIRLRGASAYDKLTHAYAPAAFAYAHLPMTRLSSSPFLGGFAPCSPVPPAWESRASHFIQNLCCVKVFVATCIPLAITSIQCSRVAGGSLIFSLSMSFDFKIFHCCCLFSFLGGREVCCFFLCVCVFVFVCCFFPLRVAVAES